MTALDEARFHWIGQSAVSAAGQVVDQFDLTQYIPQQAIDDVQTGQAYYNSFSQAAQGVSFVKGTIQLSDSSQKALFGAFEGALTAGVPVLGAALAIIWAVAPHAGAGPGQCASPPAGPAISQLQAWPSYNSWEGTNGAYGPDAAGSFEAYANPVLHYNWLLRQNCFATVAVPPDLLLAHLVNSWNATHLGPMRQVCRRFDHITSFGVNPGFDPIADGLYWSVIADPKYQGPGSNDPWGGGNYAGPDQLTKCLSVNTGSHVVHIKPLTLHIPTATPPASATASTTKAVAGVTGATVGTAALAAIGLALLKGKAWDYFFGKAWEEVKSMVRG